MMIKRLTLSILAALAFANAVFAVDWKIRDIDVNVRLYRDGSAIVKEVWDMDAREGTEVYIPRENLRGSVISDFTVMDEEGLPYMNEGEWDVNRSLSGKAGKCGINRTPSGVELCWGLGSYGSHTFTIQYRMTDFVRTLSDADYLHVQLVNDEMAAQPAHVKVGIEAVGRQIDSSWVRMWGFGYVGTTAFEDGKAVFESTEHFQYKSSVIALLRFDQGFFSPESCEDRDFQSELDKAMAGADFGKDKNPQRQMIEGWLDFLRAFICFVLFFILPVKVISKAANGYRLSRRERKKVLGTTPDKVDWYRDIPFGGDLYMTDFVLDKFMAKRQPNAIASAIILRLLQKRYLLAGKDEKGKVEIRFSVTQDLSNLDEHELGLYNMMKDASGSDLVLQDKEFSRWSSKQRNQKTIRAWADSIDRDSKSKMLVANVYSGHKFTENGKENCRQVFGFKNFLRDYTLVDKRESVEVGLWQDYLVFASLFGIADQVAKELKDINPQAFEEVVVYGYPMMNDVIRMSDTLSRSITNARIQQASSGGTAASSWGGFGGHSSFGGGGGFYGGGHGGGVR